MTGLDEAHPTRRNNERTVAGRHRMMRRADREVTDCEQIEGIVAACRIVHVGYADAEGLTIVPLNFGYEWQRREGAGTGDELAGLTLYIHSASIGRKLDAIRAAGNALDVAFSMETDCEVIAGRTPVQLGRGVQVGDRQRRGQRDRRPGRVPQRAAAADGAAGGHAGYRVHRSAGAQRHGMEDRSAPSHREDPYQA